MLGRARANTNPSCRMAICTFRPGRDSGCFLLSRLPWLTPVSVRLLFGWLRRHGFLSAQRVSDYHAAADGICPLRTHQSGQLLSASCAADPATSLRNPGVCDSAVPRQREAIPLEGTLAQACRSRTITKFSPLPRQRYPVRECCGPSRSGNTSISYSRSSTSGCAGRFLCPPPNLHSLVLCGAAFLWRCILHFHSGAGSMRTNYGTDTRFDSILLGCVFAIAASPCSKTLCTTGSCDG